MRRRENPFDTPEQIEAAALDVPFVFGAPETIYLCVGDLEYDDEFSAIEYTGEVTWCADRQGPSDIRYVLAENAELELFDLRDLLIEAREFLVHNSTTRSEARVYLVERIDAKLVEKK